MVVGDGHWMCGDGGFWGRAGSREARYGRGRYESGTMRRAALISTSPCFTSTFPRSGPIHASGFLAASRLITIPIVFIRPHEPGVKSSPHPGLPPSGEGGQRSGRLPATGAVQYPDCSPTAHHSSCVEGKLSRPSPERPIGSSFAETPALSKLWPIALATTAGLSGPRCTRPMVGVSAQCIAHPHRWPPA
jgi:hypothetical protein